MATLYEIDAKIRDFIDRMYDAVDENGEIVDVDPAEYEQLQVARQTKLENVALYIKNLEADAVAIKAEEKALKERRERMERKADRLRDLLSYSLITAGDTQFSTARCAVTFRKSEAVAVLDPEKLAAEYVVEKTTKTPDKAKIKAALKAGLHVEGALLEEHQNIQVK